jgi:hypothetical protein
MKLTIEAIPRSLWGVNLREKLGQSAWDRLRKGCYAKARNLCEICGGVGKRHPVECHEIWDYDDKKHVQKLVGLIALCPYCHEVKHYGRACAIGRAEDAQRQFLKINGCTAEQMRKHIDEVKALWEERSESEWIQDLTWLEKSA